VKTWDVTIVGAGIIGLSLAISLRKQGLRVLVVERGEPGREASYAAAGMLVPAGAEIPPGLRDLTQASAQKYPEFVHQLEDESGIKVDFQELGTILLSSRDDFPECAERLSEVQLRSFEPELDSIQLAGGKLQAAFISERSLDPRLLVAAAVKAAKHRGTDISSGNKVKAVSVSDGCVSGVQTERTSYGGAIVVNCAGAWAGSVAPHKFPVHPVKGQMLAVVNGPKLHHVVRSEKVYVVPRTDGRLIIGSTLENAGYNKDVSVSTIRELFQAAVELLPSLEKCRQHEVWAGLRPGTPDDLPIIGPTATPGYFAASGHYRDGILLAPVTAEVMTDVVLNRIPRWEITNFAPSRFERTTRHRTLNSQAS
jgi:glycine oxidase